MYYYECLRECGLGAGIGEVRFHPAGTPNDVDVPGPSGMPVKVHTQREHGDYLKTDAPLPEKHLKGYRNSTGLFMPAKFRLLTEITDKVRAEARTVGLSADDL